jgi:L-ornithine Nalpha-acyltransferase
MKHFEPIYLGEYCVKIASSHKEIEEAQRLRYFIFYEMMQAKPSAEIAAKKIDFDQYDEYADHLLVLHEKKIVGTYRLMSKAKIVPIGQFYSEDEYDITGLLQISNNIMELGRSCTHPDHRSKVAMQLLWRGIGEYVMQNNIDFMFGCASFQGCDPSEHAASLSYLYHNHLAPVEFCPRALPQFYNDMNMQPANEINQKREFLRLPPLLKGYLRLGGVVGDGAFIDHNFNTTDILMVVQTSNVGDKYVSKFSPESVRGGQSK